MIVLHPLTKLTDDLTRTKSNTHTHTLTKCMLGVSVIIESVDSISRDGPDTPIYVIHYKMPKNSD